MGASVSIVDFDRDGWPDIYITNSKEGSKNALYHNNHDGTFSDVAEQLGVADVNRPGFGVSMGAVWGDYDNDGYEDLLLIKWGKPELYHNDAGHGFTRVTDQVGLPPWINANTALWFDYDGDGLLDFFIGGYAIHGYDPAPDYPASHGCMRLPIVDAISVYNWLQIGNGVDTYYT